MDNSAGHVGFNRVHCLQNPDEGPQELLREPAGNATRGGAEEIAFRQGMAIRAMNRAGTDLAGPGEGNSGFERPIAPPNRHSLVCAISVEVCHIRRVQLSGILCRRLSQHELRIPMPLTCLSKSDRQECHFQGTPACDTNGPSQSNSGSMRFFG